MFISMPRQILYFFIMLLFTVGCSTLNSNNSKNNEKLNKIEISKDALTWVRVAEPIARKMRLSASYPQVGYYECKETQEISNTILCHFNNREEMGYALVRASCFIEGSFCGHPRGTVIGFNDPGFRMALLSINGFDLKGADLLRFYEAVEQKCAGNNSNEFSLNHFERNFFEQNIKPWALTYPNYVLITFARFSSEPWHKSLLHEVMHAQYFQDSQYRDVVESYWKNRMTEKDRTAIRLALSVGYDPKDEFLMINEFQAYILQSGADEPTSLLYKFVPFHRKSLMKELEKVGVKPIQIYISPSK